MDASDEGLSKRFLALSSFMASTKDFVRLKPDTEMEEKKYSTVIVSELICTEQTLNGDIQSPSNCFNSRSDEVPRRK